MVIAITAPAMGDWAVMAEPTTTTTRRAARCSKHAFAPSASFRPRKGIADNVTLPGERHQTCLHRAELASESPEAGDDPVNETDPTGLNVLTNALHSIESGVVGAGTCLSNPECLSGNGLQNAADGFANEAGQAAGGLLCSGSSGQYCPNWHVAATTCASDGSYQYGEALFLGLGLLVLGGDEADAGSAAVEGAGGEISSSAAGAADALSVEEVRGLLEQSGLNPDYADSFEGPITLRTVEPGQQFYRYSSYSEGEGSFVTNVELSSPEEATKSLGDLWLYGNDAKYRQLVTAVQPTSVLEGGIAGGDAGISQTLILNSKAFSFGTGVEY
jgi:hypothetical protein